MAAFANYTRVEGQILRVGVCKIRLVSLANARPWLVHSYKNTGAQAAMMQFIDQESDKVSLVDEFPPGEPKQRGDKSVCDMGTSTCDLTDDCEQVTHFQGSQTVGLSNVEKVRLIARPWRKPEGQLNKWLLKLMLESVMMHIMSNPGIQNTTIYNKYIPFLQPVVIQELVEMLEDLNCLTRTYLTTKVKASLFTSSKVERVTSGNLDDDMVLFEAKMDAPFKLGQFVTSLS